MKLIDILVQELPKLGGWPNGVTKISQDYNGEIWCWRGNDYGTVKSYGRISEIADNHRKQGKDESRDCFVTREQYEAALAASMPEWDGEGLPPVGAEFEHSFHADGFSSWHWRKCTAVGKHGVLCIDENDTELYLNDTSNRFRPIRSEADKKRDEAIESIKAMLMYDYGDDPRLNDAVILYDAMAAGKIPHIRID
ncbi:hypothetical protein [Citrobacter amalonaticus]|uniref:hypothetical protein n=1 Tax=Citrobacter amalonaticus TaxID=35703 RepID=UPI00356713B2